MQDRENSTLNAILSEQSPEQLQAIGMALAEAAVESQAILTEVMTQGRPMSGAMNGQADPHGLMDTYGKLGRSLATNPSAMLNANLDLWMGWVNLWKEFATGEISAPQDKPNGQPIRPSNSCAGPMS